MRAAVVFVMLAGCASAPKPGTDSAAAEGPGVVNTADRAVIRETVRAHIADIRKCYEAQLEKKPGLSGKLIMQWDIVEKGRTANVRVVKPLDSEVDDCIALSIEGWTFNTEPKPGQVDRVVYPFVFSQEGTGASEKTD